MGKVRVWKGVGVWKKTWDEKLLKDRWGQNLLLAPLSNPHGPKQTHTPCLSNGAHVTTQDWTPGTVVWLKGLLGLTHIQGWKIKQIVNLCIPFTGKWLLFYFSGTSQVIIYIWIYIPSNNNHLYLGNIYPMVLWHKEHLITYLLVPKPLQG